MHETWHPQWSIGWKARKMTIWTTRHSHRVRNNEHITSTITSTTTTTSTVSATATAITTCASTATSTTTTTPTAHHHNTNSTSTWHCRFVHIWHSEGWCCAKTVEPMLSGWWTISALICLLLHVLAVTQLPEIHRGKERFPGMTITCALIQTVEKIAEKTDKARMITELSAVKPWFFLSHWRFSFHRVRVERIEAVFGHAHRRVRLQSNCLCLPHEASTATHDVVIFIHTHPHAHTCSKIPQKYGKNAISN